MIKDIVIPEDVALNDSMCANPFHLLTMSIIVRDHHAAMVLAILPTSLLVSTRVAVIVDPSNLFVIGTLWMTTDIGVSGSQHAAKCGKVP